MPISRRDTLRLIGGGMAAAGLAPQPTAAGARFKVGVTDWNLKLENKPEAIALAKRLGFDGVQVSLGKGADRLPLSDPALQQEYLAESRRVGLPLASACLEILHTNGLKNDPLGKR